MGTSLQVYDPQPSAPAVVAPSFSMGDYLAHLTNPAAIQEAQQLATAYDRAVHALVGPGDLQAYTQGGEVKHFKKKSAWKKLARYFGISTRIVREETVIDPEGHTVATVIVEGRAPWGQVVEQIGKCSTREKRFAFDVSKADHDCPATAATRASNRAISDLIAAGEVSAEEVEGSSEPAAESGQTAAAAPPARTPAPPRAAPRQPATAPSAPVAGGDPNCPKCGGRMWDNRATKKNPKAPDYKCRDKSCEGVIWPPKPAKGAPAPAPAPKLDTVPLPDDDPYGFDDIGGDDDA